MERSPIASKSRILSFVGYPALLLLINYLIGAKLFTISYSEYLESNEGTFIAIARHIASGQFEFGWWPLWDLGIPYQNTYLPLLHLVVGGAGWLTGSTDMALTYHRVCGVFYVMGPVSIYAMAYGITRRAHASAIAAALYSLLSPSTFLIPQVQKDLGSVLYLRRLNILDYYGEGPYTAALAAFPLAILFLYLSVTQRRFRWYVLAGICCGATVLFNAFGAVMLGIVCFSILVTVATGRWWTNALLLGCIGALTYAWISPLAPPTVLAAIRANSPTVGGDFRFTTRSAYGVAIIAIGFVITWLSFRRFDTATRFFSSIAVVLSGIVLLGFRLNIFVLPQSNRYQVAMDIALCLTLVFAGSFLFEKVSVGWPRLWIAGTVVLAVVGAYQLRKGMIYGKANIRGADVTTSAAYRMAKWADANMGGQRMMMTASHAFHFNVFTDTPQMHGGHDPMLPSDIITIAVYQLYSGEGSGEREAEIGAIWLKALGAHAISVPGKDSTEYYKPFKNPDKFEGHLPVLWREGGDTIYGVPARSNSLAHVVPNGSLVRAKPTNGIDTAQMETYIAALDDATLPEAPLTWRGWNHIDIAAKAQAGQSVSIQMTHHPGWHAQVAGKSLAVQRDGLGFMVVEPQCAEGCTVSLDYDGGPERTQTLAASFGVMLSVLGFGIYRRRKTALASRTPFARH